jgi:hypothetical protein
VLSQARSASLIAIICAPTCAVLSGYEIKGVSFD